MKKINFSIEDQLHTIFIDNKCLLKIQHLAGRIEQGGYIFISKIKDTNEYIVELLTEPHKKDICTATFIKLSNKHKRLSKRIQRNNGHLYEIGFYHTHPKNFGCNPSHYDLNYFSSISEKYKISLFMIGVINKVNILIYSYGKQIAKEVAWIQ